MFFFLFFLCYICFFFFKQKTAYEISACLVGSEMCIRDRVAAMTGDLRGLADHLSRFQAAPRDDTSDCEVCEAGLTARFMLALGRKDEAINIAVELLKQGKYCGEEPWTLLAILTEDALNRQDLDAAERYATAMLIQPVERPADLRRAGTLLRMEAAFGAGEDGIKLLAKCLPWTENLWDQRLLFYFYLGAADFCQAHSVQHTEIKPVSYTHLRAHETGRNLVCRLLLEKKKTNKKKQKNKKNITLNK